VHYDAVQGTRTFSISLIIIAGYLILTDEC